MERWPIEVFWSLCPLRTVMLSFTTVFKKNASMISINVVQEKLHLGMFWLWQLNLIVHFLNLLIYR